MGTSTRGGGGSRGFILTLAAQLTGFLGSALGRMEKSWNIFLFILFFLPCDSQVARKPIPQAPPYPTPGDSLLTDGP